MSKVKKASQNGKGRGKNIPFKATGQYEAYFSVDGVPNKKPRTLFCDEVRTNFETYGEDAAKQTARSDAAKRLPESFPASAKVHVRSVRLL